MLIDTNVLISLFGAMADAIEQEKGRLCELDGAIGDADHGITMSIGFTAIRKTLSELNNDATPTDVFNSVAKSFLNAVGASAGPLYATAFMRAGNAAKGHESLDAATFANVICAMAEGIRQRGKAEAGDKTMLDAWLPAASAAANAKEKDHSITDMMLAVSQAANSGAQATIPLMAKKGRSAKLGERSVGHMDAGAASTAVLLEAISSALSRPVDQP